MYNSNVGTGSSTLVFRYEYAIRDHLGNTRILFTDKNNNGVLNVTAGTDNEIIQENHYYPFGMNQEGAWMNDAAARDTKYQYNLKELNDDFGLNWSDYGARWYDASIGRWNGVDPLAEKYMEWNPYNYVYNNPMVYLDPDGKSGEPVFDEKTKTLTIYSNLILYGDLASKELATETARDIENAWNKAGVEVGGYKVQFKVSGSYKPDLTQEEVENNTNIRNNYIAIRDWGSTGMDPFESNTKGANTGTWLLKDIQGKGTTTEAHEFGHGFGLVFDSPNGDFHSKHDQRGLGRPDIMAGRGTLVDPQYQYDPKAAAGTNGGTVNPDTRIVKRENIVEVVKHIQFNRSKTSVWKAGSLTNRFYD